MISSNIERAEGLRKEIDAALIKLADPEKQDKESFDFYSKFEQLLTITGVKEMLDWEIKKLYSVMMDLYSFSGRFFQQIVQIKELESETLKENKPTAQASFFVGIVERKSIEITYKYTWDLFDNWRQPIVSFSKSSSENIYPSELNKNRGDYDRQMRPPAGYATIPKYRYLLNGKDENKYNLTQVTIDHHKRQDIVKFFEQHGYTEVMPSVTFENYVSILEAVTTPAIDEHAIQRLLDSKFPKLKWAGAANQLYDIFQQLYDQGMLKNTKDELADFIYQFIQFEKGHAPSVSTIVRQLKDPKRPSKNKRIDLDFEES